MNLTNAGGAMKASLVISDCGMEKIDAEMRESKWLVVSYELSPSKKLKRGGAWEAVGVFRVFLLS